MRTYKELTMRSKIVFAMITIALVLTACGGKKEIESKNMEQIHREEGVPVMIEVVQPQTFVQTFTYTAKLEPIRRTVQGALIGGKVQAVHARVGDNVERDQVLVEFEENNPTSQFQQARASYELARSTYEKMHALYDVGGISELEMDQVRTQFENAEASFNAVQQMVKPQAPFSGVVTAMDVRVGDGAEPGDPLFTISQIDRMRVKFYAPESDIVDLARGQNAVASWRDIAFEGKVDQIAYDLNGEMQGYAVDVVFANPGKEFRSGMTADISIDVYQKDNAIVVLRKLVGSDEKGSFVYVDNSGAAARRYVEIGRENQTSLEIVSGLQAGDRLLTTGVSLVSEGAKLKITR